MEGWKWLNTVLWYSTHKIRTDDGGRVEGEKQRDKRVKSLKVDPVYFSDFLYAVFLLLFFTVMLSNLPAIVLPFTRSLTYGLSNSHF